ncbi:MAG TPA: glycosyltransferase family 39 protein [Gemmatimonadaceae bacterium]
MDARGVVPVATSPRTGWRAADLVWAGVLVAALLLPADTTATWLNATYGATHADVIAGVWILKLSVVTLAVIALLLGRYPVIAARPHEQAGARTGSWSLIILVAMIVLALGLRLYRIDTELWLDEIYLRTRYAPLEFRQLISTYDSQNHQPLYSILARIAFLAAGASDWSLRIPAVIFGVASLAAVWVFGRRVTSTSEAALGVLLLAVSYHHVWFSQNARGYTMMLFLAVLGTGVFLQLCEGKGRLPTLAWGYAFLMALATYTHLTAAFIAVGHALTLVLTTRWTSREGRQLAMWPMIALGLSAMITICLYAPMLPQVWRDVSKPTMEGVAVEWTSAGWMLRDGFRVLSRGMPGGLVTVLGSLAVLGVGVASYWRQSRVTTLMMFLPVAVTFALIVAARHNLWPRFFFFASGFLVLAALRGGFVLVKRLVRWQPERVAVAGACGVAFLSLLTVPRAWQPKQQFRAAFEFIEQERRPGDEVIALDVASDVYQLRGWTSNWRFTNDLAMLDSAERSAPRTWIVFTLTARIRAVTPELFQHLSAPRYEVVRVFSSTVGGGEIQILRHDSATTHD